MESEGGIDGVFFTSAIDGESVVEGNIAGLLS